VRDGGQPAATGMESACSMLNILHVIEGLDPAAGGPPKIAACLAAAQAALGHEVSLICHDRPEARDEIDGMLGKIPGFEQVRCLTVPQMGMADALGLRAPPTEMEQAIQQADVVHLHSVWYPILPVAARLARKHDKPYFILLNGMLDPWSLAQKRLKKRVGLALAYRKMLNGAAALHLGNADEQRLIEPLGLRTDGVILPNGVFIEEIEPLPDPGGFRAAFPQVGNAPLVLFLSRLHYKKGLDILADAFLEVAERHESAHLVVAGPDDGMREPFEQRIATTSAADRVHVIGPIYGERKYQALVDADVFCLPSRQEGFSVAITEALACGTPAVICEGCHFPEVDQAEAGRVVPLDAPEVAEALLNVLVDSDRRAAMSRNAARLIRERYTWPKVAEAAVRMYQRYLNPGGSQAGGGKPQTP